jgi:hypothetical protein
MGKGPHPSNPNIAKNEVSFKENYEKRFGVRAGFTPPVQTPGELIAFSPVPYFSELNHDLRQRRRYGKQ